MLPAIRTTLLALLLVVAACGDDSAGTTGPLAPPATFVALLTGPHAGNATVAEGQAGTVRFTVADVGTGDTMADGQIVDTDHLMTGITLDLGDLACAAQEARPVPVTIDGPIPIDGLDFAVEADGTRFSGSFADASTASGTIEGSVAIEDGRTCELASITWETAAG